MFPNWTEFVTTFIYHQLGDLKQRIGICHLQSTSRERIDLRLDDGTRIAVTVAKVEEKKEEPGEAPADLPV